MHYYKHHIGDYRRCTAHLSLLEHGVYRQLLDWYYLDESPIPNETQSVYRRLAARTEVEQRAVDAVLADFFTQTPDGWINNRCNKQIGNYQDNAEKNRESGKLGGRPKKTQTVIDGFNSETETKPNDNPDITLTTNHKPLTTNQEPLQKQKRAAPIALPDCIPVDVWEMWDRYRNSKKGWTADAKKLNLRTLTDIANKGHDPRKVVETSIERGWTGLFEPKAEQVQKSSADYRRPAL